MSVSFLRVSNDFLDNTRWQENLTDIYLIISMIGGTVTFISAYFQYLRRRIWKCKGLVSLIPLDMLRDEDDVSNIIEKYVAKM
jgi:hypothetical protein